MTARHYLSMINMNIIENNLWGRRFLRKKIRNRIFEHILFSDISFKYLDFVNCVWTECEFRNSYIGHDTTYTNCKWINTRFTGKYSGFSGGKFDSCDFDDVLVQSGLMHGLRFSKCKFSGKFRNLIFTGEKDHNNWVTRFKDCDLSELILDNVSFVSGIDFSSTILPNSGIRVFDNTSGLFTEAIKGATIGLDKDNAIPFVVLSERGQQELEVFDIPTLNYLFSESPSGLVVFEEIAKSYEITQRIHKQQKPISKLSAK